MELRRILNKYTYGIVIVCFLFTWILFYKEQTATNKVKVCRIYDDMVREYNKNLETMPSSQARTKALSLYHDERKNRVVEYVDAFEMFNEQYEYVNTFSEKLKSDIELTTRYATEGFYTPGTPVYMNILKTRYDLMNYGDLEVALDNSNGFDAVLNEKISHFMLIIIVTAFVYQFIVERKKGLWDLIHTTTKGRLALAIKRVALLGLISLLTSLIMYMGICVISFSLLGGAKYLDNCIQCDINFYLSEFTVSKIQYLVTYVLYSALSMWVCGCAIWCVLSVFSNHTLAIITVAGIGSVEYILYRAIDYKSRFNILKQINVFKFLIPNEVFTKYYNWGLGENIWSHYSSTLVLLLIFGTMSLVVAVAANALMRPNRRKTAKFKFFEMINNKISYIMSGTPVIFKELKKTLIIQKGIWAIIIATIVVISGNIENAEIISDDDMVQNEFYMLAEGLELGDELYKIRDDFVNVQNGIQKKLDETNVESDKAYLTERLSFYKKIVTCAEANINSLENLKEKGIKARVIKPFKLRDFLGDRLSDRYGTLDLLSVVTIIILSFSIQSYEIKQGMTTMLRSCRKGRRYVMLMKMFTLIAETLIVWAVIYGISWHNISKVYKFNELDWYVQGYLPMKDFEIPMTVGTYILLLMIVRLIILFAIAMMCYVISSFFTYNASFVISLGLVLPHIISIVAIKKFEVVSIVRPMDYARIYGDTGDVLRSLIPFMIMICFMFISFLVLYRKSK